LRSRETLKERGEIELKEGRKMWQRGSKVGGEVKGPWFKGLLGRENRKSLWWGRGELLGKKRG